MFTDVGVGDVHEAAARAVWRALGVATIHHAQGPFRVRPDVLAEFAGERPIDGAVVNGGLVLRFERGEVVIRASGDELVVTG